MRFATLLVLVTLFAGCAQQPEAPAALAPAPVPEDIRPAIEAPTFLPPIELGVMDGGAEPSVAVAADGTVYVTTPLALWRSDDGGKSYQPLGAPTCSFGLPMCPPGSEQYEPGLVGGGDGSLAVTKDGAVHWAGLGSGIPYQRSTDKGETWSKELDVSDETGSDREWAVVDAWDRLSIQWRGADDDGSGVFIRFSEDSGLTWGNVTRVADDGRQGPVSIDPVNGSLILAHQKPGELYVARSDDRGATWTDSKIRDVAGRPFIFPITAFDAGGTAYLVWSEDPNAPDADAVVLEGGRVVSIPTVFMIVSHDKGVTWGEPVALSTPGVPALLPWIAAGGPGRVAIAWYEGQQPAPANRLPNLFDVKVAVSTSADAAQPEFAVSQANADPVHVGSFCTEGSACSLLGGDRSMLDFFEIRLTPEGAPVLAWTGDDTVKMQRVKVFATVMDTGTLLW
ncbi:MAG TPA: sialidase family protein [Candidatus Thermoplasmatota archaeon]|nr:sialidase family protein [Candidatus Thermoplasmatota archaeon]